MSRKFKQVTRSSVQNLRIARTNLKRAVIKAKNDWITSNCNSLSSMCASRKGTKAF